MRSTLLHVALLALTAGLIAACSTAISNPSGAPATSTVTNAPATVAGPTDPPATPMATSLADTAALGLPLPADTFPLDLAYAFDSIWLAAHHQNEVYRIDPTTMEIEARIHVGNGPGWFAVTDDAVWVTLQLGHGLSRIDPRTNLELNRAGDYATCGSPLVALGRIWQMACDAHQLMSIDPDSNAVTNLTVTDYQWPAYLGGKLYMAGDTGIAEIDPASGAATPVVGVTGGFLMGYDDTSMWLTDQQVVRRVTPSDGKTVATIPVTYAGMVRPFGDHAWMIQESTAAMRVDLATNEITKTIPILYGPVVGLEAAGYLWVPTIDGNKLWRIEL